MSQRYQHASNAPHPDAGRPAEASGRAAAATGASRTRAVRAKARRRSPSVARAALLALTLLLCLATSAAAEAHAAASGHHRAAARGRHHHTAARRRHRAAHGAASGPQRTLIVEGAGDGHGVGMSQWGALGFAQHGFSYAQILGHYYTGTAIGQVSTKRIVKVLIGGKVQRIPIERYVRGVVAAEMPSTWPMAALEAQAIASRTYAITDDAGGARFDVYADTRSQVYRGKAAETPQTNEAVKATEGQVVTYEGRPAITFFFASSGGRTEDVQNSFLGATPEPWLQGVEDPFEEGPLHRWTVKLPFHRVATLLKGIVQGSFQGIEVLKRGYSPRIVTAEVLGSKGSTEVTGPELAQRLGLYDAWASFSVEVAGRVHREPDLSGQQPPAGPSLQTPSSTPPVPGEGATPGAMPAEGGTEPQLQADPPSPVEPSGGTSGAPGGGTAGGATG